MYHRKPISLTAALVAAFLPVAASASPFAVEPTDGAARGMIIEPVPTITRQADYSLGDADPRQGANIMTQGPGGAMERAATAGYDPEPQRPFARTRGQYEPTPYSPLAQPGYRGRAGSAEQHAPYYAPPMQPVQYPTWSGNGAPTPYPVPAIAQAPDCQRTFNLGTAIGGIAGALLGQNVGRGRGRLAATAAGTLAGSVAGTVLGDPCRR